MKKNRRPVSRSGCQSGFSLMSATIRSATIMDKLFDPDPDDLHRIPGLFRRWELADVLAPGRHYRLERAGAADDGTPLFAVYADIRAADDAEGEG